MGKMGACQGRAGGWGVGRWGFGFLAVLTLVVFAMSAGSAIAAAPAWRILGVAGPTHLPPVQSEVQKITVDATGGTFTVTFQAQTTTALAFDAKAGDLEAALNSLSSIGGAGGAVEVSGGTGGSGGASPYYVRFAESLSGTDQPEMSADSSMLTGGAGLASVSTEATGGTPGKGALIAYATNVGGAASVGQITLTIGPLPSGIVTDGIAVGKDWSCTPAGAGEETVTCTRTESVPARTNAPLVRVPLQVAAGADVDGSVAVTVEGGGAAPDLEENNSYEVPLAVSSVPAGPGVQAMWAGAFDEEGRPATQAGSHPYTAATAFFVNTYSAPSGVVIPARDSRDVRVELPPGFIGNPLVTATRCPQSEVVPSPNGGETLCGSSAVVGQASPALSLFEEEITGKSPVYNDVPPPGYPAEFTFPAATAKQSLVGSLMSDKDYGVAVVAPNIAPVYKVFGSFVFLEGSPDAAAGKAFLTNPTNCGEQALVAPVTTISANSWQVPTFDQGMSETSPPVVGCDLLEFDPGFAFQPVAQTAASGTAATATVSVDQAGLLDADELASPHLKKSVVVLPEGMVLNPAAADGLEACSTVQIGLKGTNFPSPSPIRFDQEPTACPTGSKLGTVELESPLVEDPLAGTIYLAAQGDNPFKSLLAMYLVVDDAKTGTVLKLPGKVVTDPTTGQLTAEFDNNPQLPFTSLKLNLRGGGPRSTMATPDVCATYTTKGSFTPWSAPESGPPAETEDSFTIDKGVGGTASCPKTKAERPFGLGFEAGSTSPIAGGHSPFTLRITRPDGAQEIDKVSVATPPGFAATLAGVPPCSDAQVAQALSRNQPGDGKTELGSPSCPASSQVGTTTIGAGVGSQPYYVKTGKVYLTGAYKGAKQSLTFIVPAVAGPFDLGVQVVRTALRVNPVTAQITAESDPIPQILQGIPLQIRDIRVDLDRPNFTINPTNCNAMAVSGQITGGSGAVANVSNRFQVDNCAALGFKPRLKLTYKGATRRTGFPALRAVLTQPPGQANISYTQVVLPQGSFVAQAHVNNPCTRDQFAANACPANSILGTATAWSPLLEKPLSGNVYFRSNGGVRELPDLVAVLQGEVDVELVGFIDAIENKKKGTSRVRNTFAMVPDAPVSRFELKMKGGRFGLIENSKPLCKGKNVATVRMRAHNGRAYKFNSRVATDCRKKGGKGKGGSKGR